MEATNTRQCVSDIVLPIMHGNIVWMSTFAAIIGLWESSWCVNTHRILLSIYTKFHYDTLMLKENYIIIDFTLYPDPFKTAEKAQALS